MQQFQIFHPTISLCHKNFLLWKILMASFHVIYGLGLPQSNILGTPMNWRSPEKKFWRLLFLESTCAFVRGPWPWPPAFLSLASNGSVLRKTVLVLGLRFFFVSLALVSSLVSSTPPLLRNSSTALKTLLRKLRCAWEKKWIAHLALRCSWLKTLLCYVVLLVKCSSCFLVLINRYYFFRSHYR